MPPPLLIYRPATAHDSALLLAWRNDAATRAASFNNEAVSSARHRQWLRESLGSALRRLYIFEEDGQAVGTVRVDFFETVDGAAPSEASLSWTVAPGARGRGIGTRMLTTFLARELRHCTVRAAIKAENHASASIAIAAGLQPVTPPHAAPGIVLYTRLPLID